MVSVQKFHSQIRKIHFKDPNTQYCAISSEDDIFDKFRQKFTPQQINKVIEVINQEVELREKLQELKVQKKTVKYYRKEPTKLKMEFKSIQGAIDPLIAKNEYRKLKDSKKWKEVMNRYKTNINQTKSDLKKSKKFN